MVALKGRGFSATSALQSFNLRKNGCLERAGLQCYLGPASFNLRKNGCLERAGLQPRRDRRNMKRGFSRRGNLGIVFQTSSVPLKPQTKSTCKPQAKSTCDCCLRSPVLFQTRSQTRRECHPERSAAQSKDLVFARRGARYYFRSGRAIIGALWKIGMLSQNS
jgi:hypothetical protein